jgi:hypothetical protein
MKTDTPMGQQTLPATPAPELEAETKGGAQPPKVAEGLKVGDNVAVRVVVGGPKIVTVPGTVVRVHKGKPGSLHGPLLDVSTLTAKGVPNILEGIGPEPAGGANLDGGSAFPCWARKS